MRRFPSIVSLVIVILAVLIQTAPSATVTYTLGDTGYYTNWSDGGGIFSNAGGAELGMWANFNAKQVVAWRTFKTAGNNTGSDRQLQIGDVFTIQVWANNSNAGGQIGFSLNDGGSTGSWANRISGSRLYIQEDGSTGSWYVNNNSGNTSLDYNVSSTSRNYQFKVYITSQTTADVELIVDSTTTKRVYNVTMNGSAGENIDAWSIYRSDGSSDIYWKQTTSVQDLGSVNLGYYLTSGNFNPGVIDDGLVATSTSTVRANNVNIGGDAGTVVILDDSNTYTGDTTINAAATARIGANNGFGTSGTVTTTATGRILMSNGITVSRALTLNGDGTGTGSLINENGNNTWSGNITLNTGSRISANSGTTLTISGTVSAGVNTLYVGGTGNTTISTTLSGSQSTGDGALFKDGDGTLTLSANNSGLTGLVRLRGGTISITNANSLGNGSGSVVLGHSTTTATLLINSNTTIANRIEVADGSTAGVINVASERAATLSGILSQTNGNSNTTKFGKDGDGTLILNNGGSTFGGQIQIGRGSVVLGVTGALGGNLNASSARGVDLGLNVGDVSQGNNVSLLASNGVTVAQSIYVATNTSSARRTIGLAGNGTNSFTNQIYLDGNLTVDAGSSASDRVNITGTITNSGGLIKTNAGTLVLSGSGANTYTGNTTINQGILRLEKSNNAGAISGGTIAVNSGGTLLLGAPNQVGDTVGITMDGGVLSTGGNADAVGKLTVTANSTIVGLNTSATSSANSFMFSDIDLGAYTTAYLGTASGLTLYSSGSSGNYVKYQLGDTINLSSKNNWADATSLNNFASKISFDNNQIMAQINFTSGSGITTLSVVAVPEPKVYVAAGALAVLIGFAEFRRRKRTTRAI